MLRPHTFRKVIELSEEEWLPIYRAAQAAGCDPREFIKRAAVEKASGSENAWTEEIAKGVSSLVRRAKLESAA